MAALRPLDFLNPLTPIRLGADGARIAKERIDAGAAGGRAAAIEAAGNLLIAPFGPGPIFGPMGLFDPMAYLPDAIPELPDLGKAGDDINRLANKALIGEAILVGGIVAVVGIGAWYLSRKPDSLGPVDIVKMIAKAVR